MTKTAIFYDPIFLEHDTGGHPENANRLRSIVEKLKLSSFAKELEWITPQPALVSTIELVHPLEHIRSVEARIKNGVSHLDADTIVCPASWEAAITAVGAMDQAVTGVITGKFKNAFCAVRPPGHHAEPNKSMGFCIFNNAAIGAKIAIGLGAARVAIIDFDVHHGNGTQAAFYSDPSVFFVSTHQELIYPGTGYENEIGAKNGTGTNLNVPMSTGAGDTAFLSVFDETIIPPLKKFAPELIIISAGFDAHEADPLAGLSLTTTGFAGITEKIMGLANEICDGRVVSTLEGGYNLSALSDSVKAHVGEMVK